MNDPMTTADRLPAGPQNTPPGDPQGLPSADPASPDGAGPQEHAGPLIDPRSAGRRRPDGPRRIRNGLKLRKRAAEDPPWPAGQWKQALEADLSAAALADGMEYARAGQVVSLFIIPPVQECSTILPASASAPTRIEALVQGRSARPYSTVIEVTAWSRQRWDQAIELMAREAIYAAKLLAGELPVAVEELCRSLGAPLIPPVGEPFRFLCTCGAETPCKHHAAALLHLIDRLVDQPLLSFNLRGLPHEVGMARLQEARTLHTHGQSTAHGSTVASSSVISPFAACLADFWRPGPQLSDLQRLPPMEYVPHAILRRLGPSPLHGKFPLVGLLASIYDSVRDDAQRLRERTDGRAAQSVEGTGEETSGAPSYPATNPSPHA